MCCALLGGGGGGLRSGAVGGAQRSGPPLRGVDGGAQPAEPRVRPVVIVVGAPGIERGGFLLTSTLSDWAGLGRSGNTTPTIVTSQQQLNLLLLLADRRKNTLK